MCGIAGIVTAAPGRNAAPPGDLEGRLHWLAARLSHRGPDARGTAIAAGVGLAHARLSIIDLSLLGAQPMWCPARRFVIAFNGEVYNFGLLRRELEAKGERFAGRSDTEVVLRLLVREGEAALARLDGMFALALLDAASGELLLARDRAGQKPLYVAPLAGGGFVFASELAPLLEMPGVDTGVAPEGLSHLLTFGFAPAPFTLRRGVRQLRPGALMRLRADGRVEEDRFAPEPGPAEPREPGDFETLVDRLEEVLSQSVQAHLVADVPVGVLLSGGVDSSAVAALAARHAGRLKSFCVVHDDPRYDERSAARAVAEAIGSEHHEIELPAEGLSESDLEVLVEHHGDPFVDSSSLNVLRLSREMRRHVTVALSGDGGDEIFAGYPRFGQLRWLSLLGRVPAPLLRAAAGVGAAARGDRARQIARSFHVAALPPARRALAFHSWFWPEEQAQLLRPEWAVQAAGATLDRFLVERGVALERDPVASAHWFEQRVLLPDDMLTKVDRMSMVAALEVRPPLLAGPVLDFAARLPFGAKHRGVTGKRVLRALARRLVPPWVIDRPKRGFALDLKQHGGALLEDATRFALESDTSPLRGLFRPEALSRLAREFAGAGPRDPEDSGYRRIHRQWLLVLLARNLARFGGV